MARRRLSSQPSAAVNKFWLKQNKLGGETGKDSYWSYRITQADKLIASRSQVSSTSLNFGLITAGQSKTGGPDFTCKSWHPFYPQIKSLFMRGVIASFNVCCIWTTIQYLLRLKSAAILFQFDSNKWPAINIRCYYMAIEHDQLQIKLPLLSFLLLEITLFHWHT